MKRHHKETGRTAAFLGGAGLGAGLMYALDPDRGARRRSLARDKVTHAMHKESDLFEKGVRDLENRATGLVARVRSALFAGEVSDEKLVARVRSKLGRCVTHPHSIEVSAMDGRVTLSGPIFASEVDELLSCVAHVRGVCEVDNRLEPHETSENVPGLQGEARPRPRPLLRRESWPPGVRLLAGGAGLTAGAYGFKRGGLIGGLLAGLGTVTLLRAAANKPTRRLVGVGAGRRAVDFHKTLTVKAPIDQVFDFWSRFENFPTFMEHVREVKMTEDRKESHWKVMGPAGSELSWEADTTSYQPNELIAWKTRPGATVEHAGIIRFEKVDENHTRVDIRMTYNPPAGAVGHVVARLFRKDPKSAMDTDMMRFKTLIEGRGVPREIEEARPAELH